MRKRIANSLIVSLVILASGSAIAGEVRGMKGMAMDAPAGQAEMTHVTRGVVKKLEKESAKVTLKHEPVASLNWPAMTMGFLMRDKTLLDGLVEGETVEVEFVREGKAYVITAVK
ncbi:MAG: copper-binding protein [Pseudazoarcus pumilus]|nr:copper-binding protein [Pseudazoarcus pumilus]